jgi:hypothetical protein
MATADLLAMRGSALTPVPPALPVTRTERAECGALTMNTNPVLWHYRHHGAFGVVQLDRKTNGDGGDIPLVIPGTARTSPKWPNELLRPSSADPCRTSALGIA